MPADASERCIGPAAYEALCTVADSVMREGQVLYPYRASAAKNHYRWIFGVVVPPVYASTSGETDVISGRLSVDDAGPGTTANVVVRFLAPTGRVVLDADGAAVDQLDVDGDLLVSFDAAEVVEIDLTTAIRTTAEAAHRRERAVSRSGVVDRRGNLRGFVESTQEELRIVATVEVSDDAVEIAVRNETPGTHTDRSHATRSSACGVHALVEVVDGQFRPDDRVSDGGLWPSLAGSPGQTRHALLTPMVLPDHTQVAPETTGELFDGLEIEEILNLRLQTLTPGEQREAAATDPWAAAALQRAGALDAGDMARLHGAQRHVTTHVRGSSVVLRPDARVDSIDIAAAGRRATVRDVRIDHDGRVFVGVTIDDDPATPLHLAHGRLFWFREHELADE